MIKKNQTLTLTGATAMEMLTMDKFEFLAAPWPMDKEKKTLILVHGAGASIPHAQLVCIENAGHLSPMESPLTVNEEIKSFIGLP